MRSLVAATAVGAAVLLAAGPATASWSVGGVPGTVPNGRSTHLAAPTVPQVGCAYDKASSTVTVSLTWTPSTSPFTTGQTVTMRGTTTPVDRLATRATDTFTHATGAVTATYAVTAVAGQWQAATSRTATLTLSTKGPSGSCTVS